MTTQQKQKTGLSPQHIPSAHWDVRSPWRAEGLDTMFSALAARQLAVMKADALLCALAAAITMETTMTPGQ